MQLPNGLIVHWTLDQVVQGSNTVFLYKTLTLIVSLSTQEYIINGYTGKFSGQPDKNAGEYYLQWTSIPSSTHVINVYQNIVLTMYVLFDKI